MKKRPTMLEVLSNLPINWFKLNEAERQDLERAIVMGKLARNTTFKVGGPYKPFMGPVKRKAAK